MKSVTKIKYNFVACLAITCTFLINNAAQAQDYVSPTKPAATGKSPSVKAQLLSQQGGTKTYMLIFAKGDEVMSGLTEFAQKNNITSAHFTAIGDATSAKVGWYDASRKMFKVIPITEPSEITSLIGDIALYNGKLVVHAHINLAAPDGVVHGGHLLEAYIFPTLEVRLTVEPQAMYKKLNVESGATVIDPDAKN